MSLSDRQAAHFEGLAALTRKNSIAHLGYVVTIAIKGFDGGLEMLAGLLILVTGPQRLYHWAVRITAPELGGNHEEAARAIRHGAERLAESPSHYVMFYLLVHGILKLGIAVALLRGGHRWVFPVASLILSGFIAYMSWRLSLRFSNWLLGFALFDVLTLVLVLNEWARGPRARPS